MQVSRITAVVALAGAVVLAMTLSSAAARTDSYTVTDPERCSDNVYVRDVEMTWEDFDTSIAVCGSGERIGSPGFVNYWTQMFELCASGEEPVALWEKLDVTRFIYNNNFNPRPSCDLIAGIAKRFNVPVDAGSMKERREAAFKKHEQVLQILKDNAADGSVTAKFLLASGLLEIEKFSKDYSSPNAMEAVTLLGELAKNGHQNAVYQFIAGLDSKYPSPRPQTLNEIFLHMYGALALSNDPRGCVKLAEEYLGRAEYESRWGERPAVLEELRRAEEYLDQGLPYATGDLASYMSKLKFEIHKQQNSPTGLHMAISAFVAGSAFLGTWEQKGFDAAVDRVEECRKNKPAVDMDPTLRLTYSLVGCIPY